MKPHELSKKLMAKRINNILLISSIYDQYIIEQDGLLNEKLSNEYAHLTLSRSPNIHHLTEPEQAIEEMQNNIYDLVLFAHRSGKISTNKVCSEIKRLWPNTKTALLSSDKTFEETKKYLAKSEGFDHVFMWHGDVKVFLAIIKLIEDQMNSDFDLNVGQVKCIILVEDSPSFYSNYLPLIYTLLIQETQALLPKGIPLEVRRARMRERPKILLATNYEQAVNLYNTYSDQILGVITDVEYPAEGDCDKEAGFMLADYLRERNPDIPIIMQSRKPEFREGASNIDAHFIDKGSEELLSELKEQLISFGLGPFIFRLPDGKEVARAQNIEELIHKTQEVPDESIMFHASNNHFSTWLYVHGEFEIATNLYNKPVTDFSCAKEVRETIYNGIYRGARYYRNMFEIKELDGDNFDLTNAILKIGSGSIGGKARGIAFISYLLAHSDIPIDFLPHNITIPKTMIVTTSFFEEFVTRNQLLAKCIPETNDDKIDETFLSCEISITLRYNLKLLLQKIKYPIAIRSSSLSEDSYNYPFAGLYSTYILPNNHEDINVRMRQLEEAIKLIWASTFHQSTKQFMRNHNVSIETEQMAVIIQELVGKYYEDYFYPHVSAVAQSKNYFPIGKLKPDDGFVQLALGLGHVIVGGENVLRFSPLHPGFQPQLSGTEEALENTQKNFYALDLSNKDIKISSNEKCTLKQLELFDAVEHDSLRYLAGTYIYENDYIVDSPYSRGPKILNFSLLIGEDNNKFARMFSHIIALAKEGMNADIEMELAFVIRKYSPELTGDLYVLQLRPMVMSQTDEKVDFDGIKKSDIILSCNNSLGNGYYKGIKYIIYVDKETFNVNDTLQMAEDIGNFNIKLMDINEQYILIGPGRWGTSTRHLGIPVKYEQICNARIIGELRYSEYNIDPSQGAHFFHSIISSNIGYFSINLKNNDSLDLDWIKSQEIVDKTKYVTLYKVNSPVECRIDGDSSMGIIHVLNGKHN